MHFLCSPFGSSGDIHPMLGLALAMKQRGHRVTFIVNGYFEDAHGSFQPPSQISQRRLLAVHLDNERNDEPMTWPVAHSFHQQVMLLPAGLGHVAEKNGVRFVRCPRTSVRTS